MSIHINNLSFSYGNKTVLKDVSLMVADGESIGIIGVSGGGKSTLLKLISGLYEVTNGFISINRHSSSENRRKSVAMVMQNAMLFPASIRDNITCGHAISDEILSYACKAAQLTDWIDSLSSGIDTFVGERGGQVSGGQAQRIAIARAIAKDAPVILLDEPTSALDGETSAAVMTALSNLTKGKTVLQVSHRPESLAACSRILRLEGGQLYVT
ncbi:MAG: ABC transporter ATP-binding protein [Lachnospiraceae bacterium]|nr:ABC transporter ATP-binding protein [Lachnospiraceae bacterium]